MCSNLLQCTYCLPMAVPVWLFYCNTSYLDQPLFLLLLKQVVPIRRKRSVIISCYILIIRSLPSQLSQIEKFLCDSCQQKTKNIVKKLLIICNELLVKLLSLPSFCVLQMVCCKSSTVQGFVEIRNSIYGLILYLYNEIVYILFVHPNLHCH